MMITNNPLAHLEALFNVYTTAPSLIKTCLCLNKHNETPNKGCSPIAVKHWFGSKRN